MKKWETIEKLKIKNQNAKLNIEDVLSLLLKNRGITSDKDIRGFLEVKRPEELTAGEVGIDEKQLQLAVERIRSAISSKESIVVYADYDADGVTAGTIMWETLYKLGAKAMPYIPHRVEEGYGLSIKGIDNVVREHNPKLIVTVDHGITAWEKVEYARNRGIEVIVTDHHVLPEKLPECVTVHTTKLCGAGVAWFVAKELVVGSRLVSSWFMDELVALAGIGTVADLVPLTNSNRVIVKQGLEVLRRTSRVGLQALMSEAGVARETVEPYTISHVLAPRLNAMGRLEHALDALRLLCTKNGQKAMELAHKLGLTNRERQDLTMETAGKAIEKIKNQKSKIKMKVLFISDEGFNPGVIGLVAGKLVEEFYLPAIVVSRGEEFSKASARSINGFNIVEAIRSCRDILVDVGGHPLAAGFTVETNKLEELEQRLVELANREITDEMLQRKLRIDMELPLEYATEELWSEIQKLQPFGMGNPEPVFATYGVKLIDARCVGADDKHLKIRLEISARPGLAEAYSNKILAIDAIAFNFGSLYGKLRPESQVDIAYTIDRNTWNGNTGMQLKVKDVQLDMSSNY